MSKKKHVFANLKFLFLFLSVMSRVMQQGTNTTLYGWDESRIDRIEQAYRPQYSPNRLASNFRNRNNRRWRKVRKIGETQPKHQNAGKLTKLDLKDGQLGKLVNDSSAIEWVKTQNQQQQSILTTCFPLKFNSSFYSNSPQRNNGWPANCSLQSERQKVWIYRYTLSTFARKQSD